MSQKGDRFADDIDAVADASFIVIANPPDANGAFNACPFKTITPTSGRNLPYDPELNEYPNAFSVVKGVPFDPLTIS